MKKRSGGGTKVTGSSPKVSGSPPKRTGVTTAKTKAVETPAEPAPKVARSAPKASAVASKEPVVAPKAPVVAPKGKGAKAKEPDGPLKFSRVFGKDAPDESPVELVAPSRTGRSVESLETMLENSEVRLKLAWENRESLDVALPRTPPFHAHAWTALWILRGKPDGRDKSGDAEAEGAGAEKSAGRALQSLLEELQLLRAAVKYVTRVDDPARETMKFGTVLRATSSILEVAPEIIKGARELQARFPALTDDTIEETERALTKAAKTVERARQASQSGALARIGGADTRQLALDVLLDSIDYLRAAARTTLARARPKLAAALSAPIEKGRDKPDEGEDPTPPEPAPTPAGEAPPVTDAARTDDDKKRERRARKRRGK